MNDFNSILHPVETLMNLSRDDLDDILLKPTYNKANLREQLRRSLKKAKLLKEAHEYEMKKAEIAEQTAIRFLAEIEASMGLPSGSLTHQYEHKLEESMREGIE